MMRVLRKRFLLEDYHLIQDQILRTKFKKKNVQQVVKRIYIKILGVKGLSGLREINSEIWKLHCHEKIVCN